MIPFLRKLARLDLPSVCFTVHSSSLVAGTGPYTRTQADEHRLFDQLADVFGTLAGWSDFRSATVSEVAQHLEREYASSRN
jgi:hypothetical protein